MRLGTGEEKITPLDGSEVTIPCDTLVIADDARPLALCRRVWRRIFRRERHDPNILLNVPSSRRLPLWVKSVV